MFDWPFPYTTTRNRKNLHLNFKSQQKNFLNWKLNLKFSASGSTRDTTLALSIESLPENRRRRERGASECSEVVRPRSSLNICDRAGQIYHPSQPCLKSKNLILEFDGKSPHSLRSLPSAEFLRMLGNEEHRLHSPITPLSFDYNRKQRARIRANSPDILGPSSPEKVQKSKKKERERWCEDGVRSPDFSSSDYAPVSTDRWILKEDSSGVHIDISPVLMIIFPPPVCAVPEPPPPPRRRVTSPSGAEPGHSPSCSRRGPARRRNSMHFIEEDLLVWSGQICGTVQYSSTAIVSSLYYKIE